VEQNESNIELKK
jgi:hypothetical protein